MKIAFLVNTIDPKSGWGRYASNLISGIESAGHQTVILKTNDDGLRGLPILKRGIGLFFSALRARKHIKDCQIIYAVDGNPNSIIAALAKRKSQKFFIIALGSYSVAPFYNLKTRLLLKYAYKKADHIFCISNYTKKEIEKKINLRNISVITPGVNTGSFPRNNKSSPPHNLIGVGELKFRKGYHVSIRSFSVARKTIPDLKYTIVGNRSDGAYFELLKKIAGEEGVLQDIRFLSGVSDKELIDLYGEAGLFILTSVNQDHHSEGFGLVFLEAAASGLPVIGTTDNGIEDAIKNGFNGILVPQNDVGKTAEAIISIFGNDERWRSMKDNSLKWAEEHSTDLETRKHLEILKEMELYKNS